VLDEYRLGPVACPGGTFGFGAVEQDAIHVATKCRVQFRHRPQWGKGKRLTVEGPGRVRCELAFTMAWQYLMTGAAEGVSDPSAAAEGVCDPSVPSPSASPTEGEMAGSSAKEEQEEEPGSSSGAGGVSDPPAATRKESAACAAATFFGTDCPPGTVPRPPKRGRSASPKKKEPKRDSSRQHRSSSKKQGGGGVSWKDWRETVWADDFGTYIPHWAEPAPVHTSWGDSWWGTEYEWPHSSWADLPSWAGQSSSSASWYDSSWPPAKSSTRSDRKLSPKRQSKPATPVQQQSSSAAAAPVQPATPAAEPVQPAEPPSSGVTVTSCQSKDIRTLPGYVSAEERAKAKAKAEASLRPSPKVTTLPPNISIAMYHKGNQGQRRRESTTLEECARNMHLTFSSFGQSNSGWDGTSDVYSWITERYPQWLGRHSRREVLFLDCRLFPHFQGPAGARERHCGTAVHVQRAVSETAAFRAALLQFKAFFSLMQQEGHSACHILCCCAHGKHRSVACAHMIRDMMADSYPVICGFVGTVRDMERDHWGGCRPSSCSICQTGTPQLVSEKKVLNQAMLQAFIAL
jgi:hypothetical protein